MQVCAGRIKLPTIPAILSLVLGDPQRCFCSLPVTCQTIHILASSQLPEKNSTAWRPPEDHFNKHCTAPCSLLWLPNCSTPFQRHHCPRESVMRSDGRLILFISYVSSLECTEYTALWHRVHLLVLKLYNIYGWMKPPEVVVILCIFVNPFTDKLLYVSIVMLHD